MATKSPKSAVKPTTSAPAHVIKARELWAAYTMPQLHLDHKRLVGLAKGHGLQAQKADPSIPREKLLGALEQLHIATENAGQKEFEMKQAAQAASPLVTPRPAEVAMAPHVKSPPPAALPVEPEVTTPKPGPTVDPVAKLVGDVADVVRMGRKNPMAMNPAQSLTFKPGVTKRGASAARFDAYYNKATTVAEFLALGGTMADLRWDVSKGIVILGK
jgi:hypothetical protein